jgi:hypothetical protein
LPGLVRPAKGRAVALDEFNRALSAQSPSGYATKVYLVIKANVQVDGAKFNKDDSDDS